MSIESEQDLQGMQRVSELVKEALATLQAAVEPGVSTLELDRLCGEIFAKHGAVSAPRLTYGAPINVFVSVNDAVVHGLPSGYRLQAGDVVTLDVTPNLNGYIADAVRSVVVPPASPKTLALVACAEAAFWAALRVTKAGRPINAIGRVVETKAKRAGFSVIRDLSGHGVGRAIHEEPTILNFYHPEFGQKLSENLVIAVEPMLALGKPQLKERGDGWTLCTRDGSVAAHYENTVIVQRGRPVVLTA